MKLSKHKNLVPGLVANAVTSVAVINLLMAAVALIKDVFLASYLGTSMQADAFTLAFFVPDTAGNNLLASSLSIACVPLFSKLYINHELERFQTAVAGIVWWFFLGSFLLMTGFYLFKEQIIGALGAGLEASSKDLSIDLFVVLLPTMVLFPLTSIGISILQVHGRFNTPAIAPGIINLTLLTAVIYGHLVFLPLADGVFLLAASILLGVTVMTGFVWLSIKKNHIRAFVPAKLSVWIRPASEIKMVLMVFFPYLGILLLFQAVLAVERFLASGLAVGSIAGLNYAYRMSQFPLWVFVAAVSAVTFPSMAKDTGLGQMASFKKTIITSLNYIFLITVPLSVGLFVLRIPVVSILLQRGSFDSESVQITSGILGGYAISIVFQGVIMICLRGFLSFEQYGVPLMTTLFSTGVTIVADFLLVQIIGSAGLGYGAAIGAIVNAFLLVLLLNKTVNVDIVPCLRFLMKVLAANVPLFFLMLLFLKIWNGMKEVGPIEKMGYVLGVLMVGLIVYVSGLLLLNKLIPDKTAHGGAV